MTAQVVVGDAKAPTTTFHLPSRIVVPGAGCRVPGALCWNSWQFRALPGVLASLQFSMGRPDHPGEELLCCPTSGGPTEGARFVWTTLRVWRGLIGYVWCFVWASKVGCSGRVRGYSSVVGLGVCMVG